LVGALHVAEMRFAANLRNDFAIDDRRLTGHSTPRAVGVPMKRSLVRMLAIRAPLIIEIGESVQLGKTISVILAHHVNLHFAETPGEADLSVGRKLLRWEQQHLIAQERLVERVENIVADVF